MGQNTNRTVAPLYRREIRRLITEKGFTAVAVEADWPDAYRVKRYVRGIDDDATAREALSGFQRFPVWMWRNQEVLSFLSHGLVRRRRSC